MAHKKKLQTWQSFLKNNVQEVDEKAYGDEVGRARYVELHLNWSVHCVLTQLRGHACAGVRKREALWKLCHKYTNIIIRQAIQQHVVNVAQALRAPPPPSSCKLTRSASKTEVQALIPCFFSNCFLAVNPEILKRPSPKLGNCTRHDV
jgi:hypothetical protein